MTEFADKAISVAIPVRNEESSIEQLISSLLDQTLPPHEIVITDGGSADATTSIIERYINTGAPIRLIKTKGALPGRGRNLSAANSSCQWLAFIDGGIRPSPDWLASLFAQAETQQADVVFGSYEPIIDSFFKECAAIAYVTPPQPINGSLGRSSFIASTLMRKHVWETVGGFPENLRSAEDLLFMRAIDPAKFKITNAPLAVVYWNIQPNLWRTFKRFLIYGRENLQAGLFREWQAAIFIQYGIIFASVPVAFLIGPRFAFLPALLWLLLLILRAYKALMRNQGAYPAGLVRNVARMAWLVPIIAAIDVAALAGSIDWLLRYKLRLYGSREGHVTRG
jgi:glycosyltransferase involved in cell wall biosynthesis